MRLAVDVISILSVFVGAATAVFGVIALAGIFPQAGTSLFSGALIVAGGCALAYVNFRSITGVRQLAKFLNDIFFIAVFAAVVGAVLVVYGAYLMTTEFGGASTMFTGIVVNILSVAFLANLKSIIDGAGDDAGASSRPGGGA